MLRGRLYLTIVASAIFLAMSHVTPIRGDCYGSSANKRVTITKLSSTPKWYVQTTNSGPSTCTQLTFTPSTRNPNNGVLRFRTIRPDEPDVVDISYFLEYVAPGQYNFWLSNNTEFDVTQQRDAAPYATSSIIEFTRGRSFVLVACVQQVQVYHTVTANRRVSDRLIDSLESKIRSKTGIDLSVNHYYTQKGANCRRLRP